MKIKFLPSLFLGLCITFACARVSAQTSPEKITSVEGITEYRLANGLKVLLFPDASKATITVNMTFMVGSRMEGYGETGMAHLLEHMVFKGSTKHTNIPQELSSHGAQPNGSTWYDRTNYFETFSATDENLNWALDMESDRMMNSFIAKKDLETEFSVVRNEFESGENSPDAVLQERIMSTAYIWHNYGKSTIGSKEDIERVPIDNLQAFYKKYYQPDNVVLLVAGKIDEAKVLTLVTKYFGSIPKPTRKIQEPYTVEPTQDGERFVTLKRVGDVQVAACGYHISSGSHPDYASIDVLNDILTNEPSGRLYKALIETKKASSVYGYAFALKDPGFTYYAAQVLKEKSLDDAKTTMFSLLDNLKNNPVTQEEVDRAKNKLLKNFDLTYTNSGSVGLTLSEYIAQGDWRLWFKYRDDVKQVTTDNVNHVIAAYFKPSNRTGGTFIPESNPDRAQVPAAPDLNAMLKDYKGNQALAATETFDASPSNIDAKTKTTTLPGGAKYAMLKKQTRGGSVNVSITLRIGSETTLQNKRIAADFAASMLMRGTKNKTYQQISDAFDKMKADVTINGGEQTVGISIQTLKENLPDVMKLVNEILRQPSFPAEEFEKLKQERLASIDQQKSEPQSISFNIFQRNTNPFPKSDFRYTMSFDEEAAAVKSVTLDDVKKFYSDFYQSTNATAAVVGDFDEATFTADLTPMLQNWSSPIKYERAKNVYFDVPSKTEKINTPDKKNAMLVAGFNIELSDADADYAALIMGNYMLGGGFLNSRLATRIRQKEGISYGVGSYIYADPIDKSGGFGSYAIYNPDNNDKLVAAYKDELDKMLKDGFKPEELKDAISGYLQGQEVNRSKDRSLSNKLASNLFLNRTMKFDQETESKISKLKVEDVNTAVKKWIKPGKLSYVEAGDFERKK